MVVDVSTDAAKQFSTALSHGLEGKFYADAEFMFDAIYRRSMFNVIEFDSGFKADIWILKEDEYAQVAFMRRVQKRFFGAPGFDAFVASPEDTIFSKLLWYQQTLWEQDFLDALGVYEVQEPNLDQEYLNEWSEPLGVVDLLARVRREAARPEPPST